MAQCVGRRAERHVQVRTCVECGGRCTGVATRGHETAHGADFEASRGLGDFGHVRPAPPACSKVRRVYAGSMPGRRNGRVFMMGLPLSNVVIQRGKPIAPSRAWGNGVPVADVEKLSVCRLTRRMLKQRAPLGQCTSAAEQTHSQRDGSSEQACSGRASAPVKVQAGCAGGGDVQAFSLFKCAMEDTVEDAARVEGGCSVRQRVPRSGGCGVGSEQGTGQLAVMCQHSTGIHFSTGCALLCG